MAACKSVETLQNSGPALPPRQDDDFFAKDDEDEEEEAGPATKRSSSEAWSRKRALPWGLAEWEILADRWSHFRPFVLARDGCCSSGRYETADLASFTHDTQ